MLSSIISEASLLVMVEANVFIASSIPICHLQNQTLIYLKTMNSSYISHDFPVAGDELKVLWHGSIALFTGAFIKGFCYRGRQK